MQTLLCVEGGGGVLGLGNMLKGLADEGIICMYVHMMIKKIRSA